MLYALLSIVAPVFVCAALGLWWEKRRLPFDTDMVMLLVTNVGVPCLVFTALSTVEIKPSAVGGMAVAWALALASFAALGFVALKVIGLPVRHFLPSLLFPNNGNMGMPLCMLAFGSEGLALAVVVFTMSAVGQFTVGSAVASGSMSPRNLVRIPALYAVALALPFLIGGWTPPDVVLNTTRLLGNMTIPVMLITLGVSLARLAVKSLRRSVGLSLLRLGMGFAVGLGLAVALDLEGVMRGVLIVQAAMPVAVFNYLFALRYATAPSEVAGMVVISTAVSFATLPLLMWYVL